MDRSLIYGTFSELATYGWLLRHSLLFEPQVHLDHPDILNPNGSTINGVLGLYDTAKGATSYWMPFTANRRFKSAPPLVGCSEGHVLHQRGWSADPGRHGLWCVNAGDGNQRIIEAVQKQVVELDYSDG